MTLHEGPDSAAVHRSRQRFSVRWRQALAAGRRRRREVVLPQNLRTVTTAVRNAGMRNFIVPQRMIGKPPAAPGRRE